MICLIYKLLLLLRNNLNYLKDSILDYYFKEHNRPVSFLSLAKTWSFQVTFFKVNFLYYRWNLYLKLISLQIGERLKIPKCFSRTQKHHWLQKYRPSKLVAPNNKNIPQGKWWKYSISDILPSKNAWDSQFVMLVVKFEIY